MPIPLRYRIQEWFSKGVPGAQLQVIPRIHYGDKPPLWRWSMPWHKRALWAIVSMIVLAAGMLCLLAFGLLLWLFL